MEKICDVKDVPVGGTYRIYNSQKKEAEGPVNTVLSKSDGQGQPGGIGYNVTHRTPDGTEIRDMHFQMRDLVVWLNAPDDSCGTA